MREAQIGGLAMDRTVRMLLVVLGAAALAVAAAPVGATVTADPPVSAQGAHTVTNGDDSGDGSFRDAVEDANTDTDPVTITFDPGLEVTLTTGEVTYTNTQPITIQGNGSTIDRTTVVSRILSVTDPAAALTVDGLTFTNGNAEFTSGGAIFADGEVTATNSTFTDNTASDDGGAIYGATGVTATDSTFTGNFAKFGGAIFTGGGGVVTVTDSTFTDNTAQFSGGAIVGNGGVTATGSTFNGNRASGEFGGGAIYGPGGVTVTNSTFTDNTTSDLGGAIFAGDAVTATDSTFTTNAADAVGGAIYTTDAVTATNSTFTENAGFDGGAIYTTDAVTATDSTFTENTDSGLGSGGAIFADGAVTATNSTFTENFATFGAGAIVAGGEVTAADSTFTDNTADDGPGGAIGGSAGVTATKSTFTGNSALTGGGAISGDGVTATESTFTGNTADDNGGAISGGTGEVIATDSTFTGNTATGIFAGGAIYGDAVSLVYATIVDNSAPTGANVFSTTTLSSFGSVLSGPMGGGENCDVGGATTSSYSYSTDDSCAFTGTGDTEDGADPQLDPLASNGGPTQTRAPAATSPLVDAIPEADCNPDGVTTDQRGVDRPQGPGCDIGAVELVPPPPPPPPTTAPSPTTAPPSACPATAAQAGLLPFGATPDAAGWLVLGGAGLLVAPIVWRSRAGRVCARRHWPTSMRALHARIRTQLLWLIATFAMIAVFVACQPVKKLPPC